MIDLTPLDVRKKKHDLNRVLRGYDPSEVDAFLELAAERLEELVRENAALKERAAQLGSALASFRDREQAMNAALVSAQQLREEISTQSRREADLILAEARLERDRLLAEAARRVELEREAGARSRAERDRFLRAYRAFLETQLREVEAEVERARASAHEARESGPGGSRKVDARGKRGSEPAPAETEGG